MEIFFSVVTSFNWVGIHFFWLGRKCVNLPYLLPLRPYRVLNMVGQFSSFVSICDWMCNVILQIQWLQIGQLPHSFKNTIGTSAGRGVQFAISKSALLKDLVTRCPGSVRKILPARVNIFPLSSCWPRDFKIPIKSSELWISLVEYS